MKRGFTIIELLVVISIISLLSSIVYANLAQAREKARDSTRIQQVRQIDNAVALYKADHNNRAPDLQGTCNSFSVGAGLSNCVALSTAGPSRLSQQQAWGKFVQDLQPYLQPAPLDPCGTDCGQDTYEPLGYVYIAPAGVEELCASGCSGLEESVDESYVLYTTLETATPPQYSSSSSGSGMIYVPPPQQPPQNPDTIAPSAPTNAIADEFYDNGSHLKVRITWSPSTDTGGSGLSGYRVYRNAAYIGFASGTSKTDLFDGIPNQVYCWNIIAVDVAGNVSTATQATPCHTVFNAQQQGGGGGGNEP